MGQTVTLATKISLLLFLYVFLVFFYQAVTTVPFEGDSLAYHIPIAQSILDGSVVSPSHEGYALGFYPGSAELILSLFMMLGLPLNLYNVVGWSILTCLCYLLGRAYRLDTQLSLLYAVSSGVVLSIIRLLTNQTIDIWLAVFFTATLLLLRKPVGSLRFFFLLGLTSGMLIGSKFSAPVYAVILFLLFGRHLLQVVSPMRSIIFLLPFLLLGLSWYIRNIVLTGNPLYPQGILGLPGNERFLLMEWVGWKTLLFYPGGAIIMLFSFFSEYMLWILTPIVSGWYLFRMKNRGVVYQDIRQLFLLGILSLIVFFFLPSTPDNVVTYLRYLFPACIPLMLCTFLLLKEVKRFEYVLPLILINNLLIISFTPHQPKLFLVFFILGGILLYKYDILIKYLSKR